MSQQKTTQTWSLTSAAVRDAYTDFILSRQAMNCTVATLTFYRNTVGKFLEWIEQRGITSPEEVTARYIREYIAELAGRGLADTSVWNFARAIKTMLIFWHGEGYIPEVIRYEMPKKAKKRLPVLNADQLQELLQACNVRDKAIILFLADSGLRREEVARLDWDDIDMQSGLVRVKQGKGRKDRTAVIGATTRRALLKYRRTLKNPTGALFHSTYGGRMAGNAYLQICERLTQKTGIHVTPHALKRTFGRSYGRLVNASKDAIC